MQVPTVTFGIVGLVFLALQPESPRFLVSTKRYQEARDALSRIAKINGMGEDIAAKFIFPNEDKELNKYLTNQSIDTDDTTS